MVGAIVLVVAMLALIPIVLASGGVMAAILGSLLTADAEERYAGSELVDLNV